MSDHVNVGKVINLVPPKKSALDIGAIPLSEKGAPNGVATLDSSGKIPTNQLPKEVEEKFYKTTPVLPVLQATLPADRNWSSVAFGNNTYVAVATGSDKGAFSTDGLHWSEMSMPSTADWMNVIYGDGLFLASCENEFGESYAYSADGINWTQKYGCHRLIAYGNNKYVSIQPNYREVNYSTDGIYWQNVYYLVQEGDLVNYETNVLPPYKAWTSIAFGNEKFVVVASGSNVVAYSSDGNEWFLATLPSSSNWSTITFCNDRFVAVAADSNEFAYSFDGIDWKTAQIPLGQWEAAAYGEGRLFVVSSSGRIISSTDLTNWIEVADSSETWSSVVYGDARFVAIASSSETAIQIEATSAPSLVDSIEVVLSSTGWSGDEAPYTQILSGIDRVTFVANGDIGLSDSATAEQAEAARNAMLRKTGQGNGSITIMADGDKPVVDIPLTINIMP